MAKKKKATRKVKTKSKAKAKAKPKAKKTVSKKAKKVVAKKSAAKKSKAKVKTAKKKAVAKKAAKKATKKAVKKTVKKKTAKAAAPKKVTSNTAKKKAAPKAATQSVAPATKPASKKFKAKKTEASTVPVEVAEVEELVAEEPSEVVLTDAEGRRYCRVNECDQLAMVDAYCRYHYLLHWKRIQARKRILSDNKLQRYIEELTARYPDKFLEMLRKDLRTQKEFTAAIQELELDESGSDENSDFDESDQTFIEEIRGISSESGARGEDEY